MLYRGSPFVCCYGLICFRHNPFSHGVEIFRYATSFTAHQPGLPGIRYSFLDKSNLVTLQILSSKCFLNGFPSLPFTNLCSLSHIYPLLIKHFAEHHSTSQCIQGSPRHSFFSLTGFASNNPICPTICLMSQVTHSFHVFIMV